ncbi:MAG: cytidylate kinase-like family protein [Thermoguttaceae bacterium]|jgi:cytidylate kinase
MKEQTREDPKILAAAERQMQAWALNKEIADRSVSRTFHQAHCPQKKCFLTISREAGAGGSEIAAIVGKRLGWEVLDKNLLDKVAERFNIDRSMLNLVDETRSNWVYDVLGTWMDSKVIPHETYVSQLSRVILAAARQANFIIVGRGARFILPREKVLAIRLVASEAFRLKRIMQSNKLSEADARRHMHEVDQGRREFVHRFFHHNITDPHLYDLVINTEGLGIECAAEEIIAAARLEQPATVLK